MARNLIWAQINSIAHTLQIQLISSCLVVCFVAPLGAESRVVTTPPTEPDFSQVRKLINEQIASKAVPSVSIAVARRGKIIWEESFGFADLEKSIPATPQTMYYLSSVSKSITATAVTVLNERKRIDLDRPINDYIKPAHVNSFLWNPAEATVRRVANHTSGLTTFDRTCFADQPNCHISSDETIQHYGVIFWPPGDHFDYSNLGYGILGEAVARTSGKDFGTFLRQEIFDPLGMKRCSLAIQPDLQRYAATRYSYYSGGPHARGPFRSAAPGASAIYCSAHDLALFGLFHLKSHLPNQKRILSDSSIDSMQNSTVEAERNQRYGLGWWVNDNLHGFRGVLAQGGTDDSKAYLQLIPAEGIAVVILTNSANLPPNLLDEILSALLPSYRQDIAATQSNSPAPSAPGALPSPSPASPPPSLLGNWSGKIQTYKGSLPLSFSIAESGKVEARIGSAQPMSMQNARLGIRYGKPRLAGRLKATSLGTDEDTGPEPYDLTFYLLLQDQKLCGAVTTSNTRSGAALSYWAELEKRQ